MNQPPMPQEIGPGVLISSIKTELGLLVETREVFGERRETHILMHTYDYPFEYLYTEIPS